MSFSWSGGGTNKAEALAALKEAPIPEVAKTFVEEAAKAYSDEGPMRFSIAGHMFDGSNYDVSSLSVSVEPRPYNDANNKGGG